MIKKLVRPVTDEETALWYSTSPRHPVTSLRPVASHSAFPPHALTSHHFPLHPLTPLAASVFPSHPLTLRSPHAPLDSALTPRPP